MQLIDLYDSDIIEIEKVLLVLRDRLQAQRRNYPAAEREIRERFAEIGFVVDVNWFRFAAGGIEQQDGALPEVTVMARCEPVVFDHDRQVHEVTSNILELPGQDKGEIIRTDRGDAFRKFRQEHGNPKAHSHDGGEAPHSHGAGTVPHSH